MKRRPKMKKLNFLLILVGLSFINTSISGALFPGELYIHGIPSNKTLTLDAEGTSWYGPSGNWEILTSSTYRNHSVSGESAYYFDFIESDDVAPDGVITYALYKVQFGSNEIYLDYRDSDYNDGTGDGGTNYSTPDLEIRWADTTWQHKKINGTWATISEGNTIGMWNGGRKAGGPVSDHFEPTDPSNLSVAQTANDFAFLSWSGSNPEDAQYYIYRLAGGSWNWVNSTSLTTYIDDEVDLS